MPYLKSIPIHATVNRSIAYILDSEKTDDLIYTTSLNCMCNAADAYLNMKVIYEHYSGEKYNAPLPLEGKGRVKAIHYIQSFDPKDDNVTPELAHRIAKAFARKAFGDDCQIVIATHCDKSHIHSHFILNTYGIDGHKFNDNKTTLKILREISDRVCLAFGIQPIAENKGISKSVAYNEWEHKKRGTSWKQKIRLEIDSLIGSVKNIDELLYEMELKGYTVKRGKYISVKAEGQQRFVRLKTLGEDYCELSLVSRIKWKDTGSNYALSSEPAPICNDYIRTINDVTQLAREGKKIQRKRDSSAPYSIENDVDIYKLSAQLYIINRDNIHSVGELEGKISKLKDEYENTRRELNSLTVKAEWLDTLVEQADTYLSLSDKPNLSDAQQLQLNICRQTLSNNNIQNTNDIDRLKNLNKETHKKIAVLKKSFDNYRQLYEVYSDIANTYNDISSGDYISRLVEEKKKEQQKQQTAVKKSHSR